MSINFIDPREDSVLVKTDQEIANFFQDLAAELKTHHHQLNDREINYLIGNIKNINSNILHKINKTPQGLNINIKANYIKDILEAAEIYNIPIILVLSEKNVSLYEDIITGLQNKTCLKSLLILDHVYTDQKFIAALLTTGIYELAISRVEYDISPYFQLLTHNKLTSLSLGRGESNKTDDSLLFNKLLRSLSNSQPNKLRTLNLGGLQLSNRTNKNLYIDIQNSELLAKLIQTNVNLEIISMASCKLSFKFLSLLWDNLSQVQNTSQQPLILNLSDNRNVPRIVDKIAKSLARNVNISDLKIGDSVIFEINPEDINIDENGANLLAAGLLHNTILQSLSLEKCPIGHGIQSICRAIMNNPHSNLSRLDVRAIGIRNNITFDLADAKVLAELIRSNKMIEINLYESIGYGFQMAEETELKDIYLVLLAALEENSSLAECDLYFGGLDESDPDIATKIKEVLINRDKPIRFRNLRNTELKNFMKLQLDNYNLSNKTLIQILQEYK